MTQETNQTTTEEVSLDSLFKQIREEQKEETPQRKPEELLSNLDSTLEEKPKVEQEVAETVETAEEVEQTPTTNTYNKILDYIEKGFLKDIQVQIGEGEDAKLIYLSDYKDIDEDLLDVIIKDYKESEQKEIGEKYISTEGLDETTKKMIELKKAGGDLSELIQAEVQYLNPLSKFDLENETDQEIIIRHYLQSKEIKPKVIEAQIEAMKEDFTLDVEAKKVANMLTKQFDDFVDQRKAEQMQAIEEEKAFQKEFKKQINTVLKEYNLPENISKVVLENATSTDEAGLTNTDKLYFESKKDPALHAEISFFLNNKEEFKKFLAVNVKNKTVINEVNKILKINPKNIKTDAKPPKTELDKKEEVLNEFFNRK